jgi:hypothetical protein
MVHRIERLSVEMFKHLKYWTWDTSWTFEVLQRLTLSPELVPVC